MDLVSEPKMTQNKKRNFRPRKRKNKLVIVFDENARREYLTGFHKRKLQRKRKAKEELDKQIKLERKRIKAEAKEQYKKMLLSQKPIPDLEDLLSEEIDMGTHSVSVTELSTAELAKKNNWIGINEVKYEEEEDNTNKAESDQEESDQELEGMEIKTKNPKPGKTPLKNVKDIKKIIQKQATLSIKNSKVFQKKAKYDKIKSIKLKKREEKKQRKLQRKNKNCKS